MGDIFSSFFGGAAGGRAAAAPRGPRHGRGPAPDAGGGGRGRQEGDRLRPPGAVPRLRRHGPRPRRARDHLPRLRRPGPRGHRAAYLPGRHADGHHVQDVQRHRPHHREPVPGVRGAGPRARPPARDRGGARGHPRLPAAAPVRFRRGGHARRGVRATSSSRAASSRTSSSSATATTCTRVRTCPSCRPRSAPRSRSTASSRTRRCRCASPKAARTSRWCA